MNTFKNKLGAKIMLLHMKEYFGENTTIRDLISDERVGKYMPFLYYPKRYLDNVINQTITETAPYGLEGFNFLKEQVLLGNVEQFFVSKEKPDVSIIHITHKNNSKVIFVLSGGGLYSVCHGIEGLPIAYELFNKGFDIFLLTYSIDDGAYKNGPLDDLASAISFCLTYEKELKIDMSNYIVLGASAAGFVAGHFGTTKNGYLKYKLPKPGLLALIYPVINLRTCLNEQTAIYCLRREYSEENLHDWGIDENVDSNYPKTFILHSKDDPIVTFENAERMVKALRKYHIPYFSKFYETGGHGWSIAKNDPAKGWTNLLEEYYEKEQN